MRFSGKSVTHNRRKRIYNGPRNILKVTCFITIMISFFTFQNTLWLQLHEYFLSLSMKFGFTVQSVSIEGRQYTPLAHLREATGLKRGNALFSYNPYELKKQIQKLPWVHSTIVERRLPNAFYIRLAETRPIASWKFKDKTYLIDSHGNLLENKMPLFSDSLITLIGEKAPDQVLALLKALSEFPEIKRRVIAAVFLRCGRWNLHFENQVTIKLPEMNILQALKRLTLFEEKYPAISQQILAFDLRFPRSFILKFKPNSSIHKEYVL